MRLGQGLLPKFTFSWPVNAQPSSCTVAQLQVAAGLIEISIEISAFGAERASSFLILAGKGRKCCLDLKVISCSWLVFVCLFSFLVEVPVLGLCFWGVSSCKTPRVGSDRCPRCWVCTSCNSIQNLPCARCRAKKWPDKLMAVLCHKCCRVSPFFGEKGGSFMLFVSS